MMPKIEFGTGVVSKQGLELPNGNVIEVGCKHKRATIACGGCYARLDRAIDLAILELRAIKKKSPQVKAALAILDKSIDARMEDKPSAGSTFGATRASTNGL